MDTKSLIGTVIKVIVALAVIYLFVIPYLESLAPEWT